MRFARRVYGTAGIYGILVLLPQFLVRPDTAPALHYGFVGTAFAWQLAFLVLARDPARYRPLMPATWVEKGVFGVAALALRPSWELATAGALDLILGALFVEAWRRTKPA